MRRLFTEGEQSWAVAGLRAASALTLLIGTLVGVPGTAISQETVTLKAVTTFAQDHFLNNSIHRFKEFVEDKTEGRLKIDIIGGDDVVPVLEQFEAVRNGVVDVVLGIGSYYENAVPEAMVLLYNQTLWPSDIRRNGLFEKIQKAHLEKGNVVFYAQAGARPGTLGRFYFREEIKEPDFTGMKLRVSGSYVEIAKALGATPVSISPAETYLALERGVVDGMGYTYGGVTDLSFHEVVSYVLDHPFYSFPDSILINKAKWDGLPEDLKLKLTEIAPEYEEVEAKAMTEYLDQEDGRLKAAGMKFYRFSEEGAKKFMDTAADVGWKAFLAKNPEKGAELKALAEGKPAGN